MALEYLWAGLPCRRSVRRPPSPRGDAIEIPVGKVPVPKTGQRPAEDLSKSRQLTRTGGVSGEALPVDVLDDQTGKSHPENGGDVSQGTVDLSLFRNLVRDNLLLVV